MSNNAEVHLNGRDGMGNWMPYWFHSDISFAYSHSLPNSSINISWVRIGCTVDCLFNFTSVYVRGLLSIHRFTPLNKPNEKKRPNTFLHYILYKMYIVFTFSEHFFFNFSIFSDDVTVLSIHLNGNYFKNHFFPSIDLLNALFHAFFRYSK